MKKLLLLFAAGCIGGFANSLTVWLFGDIGISQFMGVAIAPSLSPQWLYPRIVWGGLWGLLFVMPFMSSRIFWKGSLLSLAPTAVQLFIVFPLKAHKGIAGLDLGLLTPLLVVFFNWIWGVATAATLKLAK